MCKVFVATIFDLTKTIIAIGMFILNAKLNVYISISLY
jgi:hypothetical protein